MEEPDGLLEEAIGARAVPDWVEAEEVEEDGVDVLGLRGDFFEC